MNGNHGYVPMGTGYAIYLLIRNSTLHVWSKMIVRRALSKKHRIQMGRVPGRGIRTKAASPEWNKTRISLSMVTTLFNIADYVFVTCFQVCCKRHVLPYTMRANGTLVINTAWKRILLHWAVLVAYAAITVHKLMAFMRQAQNSENMNVQTLMSLASLAGYAVPLSFSVSTLIKKQETCELVNTWSEFIREFIPSCPDAKARMPNIQTAVEILAMVPVLAFFVVALPATTVGFQGIPGSFVFATDELGLIPRTLFVPHVVWRVLFWPLEVAVFYPLAILIGCTTMIVTRGLQVAFTCAHELGYLLFNVNWVLLNRSSVNYALFL